MAALRWSRVTVLALRLFTQGYGVDHLVSIIWLVTQGYDSSRISHQLLVRDFTFELEPGSTDLSPYSPTKHLIWEYDMS